jgi:hypothetical protein
MAEENISVQSFTRVHMVPRVNQGQTVAIAFEIQGSPPVAYGAPVHVLQQLFLRIPQVLADAKKVRAEAGLVDAPDAPVLAAVPWVVESLAASPGNDGQIKLAVQMNGCSVDLSFSLEQASELAALLSSIEKPKDEAKKVAKVAPKIEAKAVPSKAMPSKVVTKEVAKKQVLAKPKAKAASNLSKTKVVPKKPAVKAKTTKK